MSTELNKKHLKNDDASGVEYLSLNSAFLFKWIGTSDKLCVLIIRASINISGFLLFPGMAACVQIIIF